MGKDKKKTSKPSVKVSDLKATRDPKGGATNESTEWNWNKMIVDGKLK